jgi:hypothetical protein
VLNGFGSNSQDLLKPVSGGFRPALLRRPHILKKDTAQNSEKQPLLAASTAHLDRIGKTIQTVSLTIADYFVSRRKEKVQISFLIFSRMEPRYSRATQLHR